MARILIVEDEAGISSFLEKGLAAAGHAPFVVADGREGAAMARDDAFDLVVLDLGLPGLDGLSVLRQLRARGERLPVIILTARDDLPSTLDGFASGASDYMPKPFRLEELLARVNARLASDQSSGAQRVVVGCLSLDLAARTVTNPTGEVALSAREFALAEVFFAHPGHVLSREQLLSRVWGYDFDGGSNVVDVYVGYLRRKLGADAIETVRGMGYRLSTEP